MFFVKVFLQKFLLKFFLHHLLVAKLIHNCDLSKKFLKICACDGIIIVCYFNSFWVYSWRADWCVQPWICPLRLERAFSCMELIPRPRTLATDAILTKGLSKLVATSGSEELVNKALTPDKIKHVTRV